MLINSSAPTGAYASSSPISAMSSATFERRIVGNEALREAFVRPLFLARRGTGAPPARPQGLHERPEAPRHVADQARIQTAGRHRARHRPPLPMPAATPSTPCSPPPATTFAASSHVAWIYIRERSPSLAG